MAASWIARTDSVDDAIKWAMIAPPNDVRNRKKVEKAMKMRNMRVAEFEKTLNPEWISSNGEGYD